MLSNAAIAVLLGFAFSCGMELRMCEGLGFSWGERLGCFAAAFAVCFLLATGLEHIGMRRAEGVKARVPKFFPLFALFFCTFVPALLAYCPGIVAYDATAQILQGIDGTYKTNHPLVHTLLLSGCVRLGNAVHSYTLGAGLYSLLQMAGLAALMARCVQTLARLGVSRWALWAVIAFYALYPVHAIMAISTTKDTIFSGFVALFLLHTIEALRMGKAFFEDRRAVSAYVALAVLMCLWRNNGILALLVLGAASVIFYRGMRIRLAALMLGSVCAYVGVSGALSAACSAQGGSALEMLGVPIQQMARVAKLYGEKLPEELSAQLKTYMPLGEENPYAAHLVDPVKMEMEKDAFSRDPAAFVTLWAKIGLLYPQEYIEAALLLNQGIWDPLDISHAQVYNMWEAGQHGYLQTKFQRHIDDARGILLDQKALLPGVYRLYERFCTDGVQLKSPFTRIFFAPAGMVWICLSAMIRFFARGQRAEGVASTLLLGLFLPHLLGPCALVRYAYPFFMSAPLLLTLTGRKNA